MTRNVTIAPSLHLKLQVQHGRRVREPNEALERHQDGVLEDDARQRRRAGEL